MLATVAALGRSCGPPGSGAVLRAARNASPVSAPLRIVDLPIARFRDLLVSEGRPSFRAGQVLDSLYKRVDARGLPVRAVSSFSEITTLSKFDRDWLASSFNIQQGGFNTETTSADGTIKWLYACPGDGVSVESVFIPDFERRRGTVCVSSQGGCSLACAFCRTGTQPLSRNLSAGDIVGQVVAAMRAVDQRRADYVAGQTDSHSAARLLPPPVNRVVMMGQGEPLLNYRAVVTALDTMTHQHGLRMAPHHIVLSTAGVAPFLPRLAEDAPLGLRLAVSLHAPNDALRTSLMDVNERWPLADVMAGIKRYIEITMERVQAEGGAAHNARVPSKLARAPQSGHRAAVPKRDGDESDSDDDDDAPLLSSEAARQAQRHNGRRRTRVSFEYVGLASNTTPALARELANLLRSHLPPSLCHINLIPFNEWKRDAGDGEVSGKPKRPPPPPGLISRAPMSQLLSFQRTLMAAGIRTTIRTPRGTDILGACGQLRSDVTNGVAKGLGLGSAGIAIGGAK